MVRSISLTLALTFALVGCGLPVRDVADDAKAAKAQAHDAVQAAEDAAKRADELSRAPLEESVPAGDSDRHE
jgi:hypothetical protein